MFFDDNKFMEEQKKFERKIFRLTLIAYVLTFLFYASLLVIAGGIVYAIVSLLVK